MPGLIKSTAPAWSKKVIVPYILVTDGADPANAEHPFLRNIWNHRDVKSTATFRSRLESAVKDFATLCGARRARFRLRAIGANSAQVTEWHAGADLC
jgi:hypothetical protein